MPPACGTLAERRSCVGSRRGGGTTSVAGFVDEMFVSEDELSDEERGLCSLLASLAVGLPMTAAGLIAGFL